ncbi:MAG: thioredoxin family protein [Thermoanaerobaculum sp.]|nr:thioredoxin family protein [Thermoanaerobaculum sp.]MDW7968686.1 thioredoxin family protein [Thermoanaerobaculum sp.]
MKVRTGALLAMVFGVVVGLSLIMGPRGGARPAAAIPWEADLASAMDKAQKERKLVMVDFYTDWCRWCQRLESTTLADPSVSTTLRERFVAVRLNAEAEGKSTADAFAITTYPTLVFLDGQGREVHRIAGFLEADEFLRELRSIPN